ncbi:hypothetical protein [Kriegella aquimaris]|uniref:Uncharacterized protein n=1 Tax=Kriegella aquimaris TaxID=192904 RepID=A0A1G9V2J4_9FLAO|nr:hypothetical protein [Kriegella aquimaris]SDM66310.1 hypothetical protein SAMN04488514_11284 [Kriegella aquimaris]
MIKAVLIILGLVSISLMGSTKEKCFVTYQKNGFKGHEKFIVYVRDEVNPIYYYGFEISHEVDTSLLINTNQYRLQKASIYEFDGRGMRLTGLEALATGESEFVYKTLDAIDFTGGWHGDERLTEVDFFIDGRALSEIELSKGFSLKPCTEFSYEQKSLTYVTKKNGQTDYINDEVEGVHSKTSTFRNSGYKTTNRIIWQKQSCIAIGYMSISSIATDMGEFCQSDISKKYKLDRLSGRKINDKNSTIYIWNETNGTSAIVTSEFSINNDSAIQFVWDVPNYNKYYRNVVYENSISVNKGNEWKSVTNVLFNMEKK